MDRGYIPFTAGLQWLVLNWRRLSLVTAYLGTVAVTTVAVLKTMLSVFRDKL